MSIKRHRLLAESMKTCQPVTEKSELEMLLKSKDLKKEEKVPAMQSLYTRLGVKDDATIAVENLHNEAWSNLEKVKLSKRQLDQLSDFANSLLNRER